GNVDISSATFAADTLFSGAAFYGMAKFDSVHFAGTVRFSQSTFSGFTSFARATFSKPAYFNSSRFSEIATFSSATFRGDTDFSSATFSKNAYFHSATFSGNASFVNSQFTALTVFANSTYETKVPDFRGAKLHEATEWHGVRWPPSPRDKDAAHSHVYAYERLKQEMERLKKHEDEQFSFAKELRARRLLVPIWSSARLLNILYDVSSDYGQSAERPLFRLLALFAIGFAFFAAAPVFKGARMALDRAAGLSFANIFSFLPMKREMVASLSGAAQVVGVAQSFVGLVLLFLLGLALRNKFRMK